MLRFRGALSEYSFAKNPAHMHDEVQEVDRGCDAKDQKNVLRSHQIQLNRSGQALRQHDEHEHQRHMPPGVLVTHALGELEEVIQERAHGRQMKNRQDAREILL